MNKFQEGLKRAAEKLSQTAVGCAATTEQGDTLTVVLSPQSETPPPRRRIIEMPPPARQRRRGDERRYR